MATELRQVRLRSGTAELTCWVEARVKRGDRITLKEDPERWWDVTFASLERRTAAGIPRGWHAGGL